jgi:glutathione S-transferase
MSELTVLGFPRSTFVHIVRLILTHKDVAYTFRDLEPDVGSPVHLALHPFDRVPILRHGDFTLYETSAIVPYLEEVFPTPSLQPETPQDRARMNQWISAVNSYYYPYMIYHVSHERNVFPQLGIASDEEVVAHALPKVEIALQVMERQLAPGQRFLLGGEVCLADYYLLPSTYAFGLAPEGKAMYADSPAVEEWRARMERRGDAGSLYKSGSHAPNAARRQQGLARLRPRTRTPRSKRDAELGPSSLRGSLPFPRARLSSSARDG